MVIVHPLRRRHWRLAILFGIIGIAGVGAGFTLPTAAPAGPEIRKGAPPEAFKSGGERSVPILREIAEKVESGNERSETVLREIARTLERIDTRLQRIEQAALRAANKGHTSPPPNPNQRQ